MNRKQNQSKGSSGISVSNCTFAVSFAKAKQKNFLKIDILTSADLTISKRKTPVKGVISFETDLIYRLGKKLKQGMQESRANSK